MTTDKSIGLMACIRRGERVLMDGALGTELERRGVPFEGAGWSAGAVRDHGEVIREVHEDYLRAGARLHIVNSFALARHVLEAVGLGSEFEILNRKAVQLFDQAVACTDIPRDSLWAAGSLSTFCAYSDRSKLPKGETLVANCRDQARILADAGVDLFALEMLFDVDVSLAMLAATREMGLPVILGFTCHWDQVNAGKVTTNGGMEVPVQSLDEVFPVVIDALESDDVILSIMHSEADVTDAALEILRRYWDGPIAIYPNSGHFVDLHMQFDSVCSTAEFVRAAERWQQMGVQVIGGCCGIGPGHIEQLGTRSPG